MKKIMILRGSRLVAVMLAATIWLCLVKDEGMTAGDGGGIGKAILLERLNQIENGDEVEKLYRLYMQEETEENNKIEHVGGQGPLHIQIQREVLNKLMQLPLEKAREKFLILLTDILLLSRGWITIRGEFLQSKVYKLI